MPTPPSDLPASKRSELALVWGARVVWLALALLGGLAIGDALADRSRPVQLVAVVVLWTAWAVGALAMLVPSTVGLTVLRSIVPAVPIVGVLAATHGSTAIHASTLIGLAVVAAAIIGSGEFGEVFVQASAYGAERRLLLRPPVAYLLPTVVSWCLMCASAIAGPLLLSAGNLFAGVPVTAAALALGWFLAGRFHRLTRRWLVVVPAGIVIHDTLVLSEAAMFRQAGVARLGLALADTEAADLTGPAAGHAVEITLSAMETIVLAGNKSKPGGTALHVRSMLVAPTRPGRALRACEAGGFPVG